MKGIELEADFFITNNLMAFGTYTYNKSSYVSFIEAETGDLSGKDLPLQPRNKITAGLRYRHVSGFSAGITTKWVDAQYLSALNEYSLPSYTVTDARLAYEWDNDLSFSIALRNLFDEDYPVYGYNWGGGDVSLTPASPRTVFARIAYTF